LLLCVESLWALNLFAIIAAIIAGVLVRCVQLAIFGTNENFMVSGTAARALPVGLSAFVDFL